MNCRHQIATPSHSAPVAYAPSSVLQTRMELRATDGHVRFTREQLWIAVQSDLRYSAALVAAVYAVPVDVASWLYRSALNFL